MLRLLAAASLLITSLFCFATIVSAEEKAEAKKVAAKSEPAVGEAVVGEAVASPIVITPELVEAHQAYQLAQLRWQQYRFVELPRQRRLLDDQVRLLDSEIRVLKRRERDFRPFLRVGFYSPVRNTAENNQLALQAAEQNLRQLKNERINLMRYSRQNSQLYQLEVLRTAAHVQAVMAAAQSPQDAN